MKIGRTLVSTILLGFVLAACSTQEDSGGSSASGSSSGGDFTPVIAKVGDFEITQGFFDARYRQLSPAAQAQFSGEGWRERFLDEMVEESIIYQEALADKIDRHPEIEVQLEAARRTVLVRAYAAQFTDSVEPREEDIAAHYELRKDSYRELDRVLVSHIRCASEERITEAYAKLQSGESFEKVAYEYDEDPNSKANKGLIGWINPGGFVLGVGYNQRFTDIAFDLEFGEFSPPEEINGYWHIIRAGTKIIGPIPTLEEARDRIIEDLRPVVVGREYKRLLAELEKKYDVQFLGEFKDRYDQTADQLYKLGAEAKNPHARADYYAAIVEQHPESEYVDDALFVLGFLYSEEIMDVTSAIQSLKRLVREYPDSPYVDDAEWLMKNLNRSVRGLQDAGAADADQLQKNLGEFQDN